MHGSRRRDVGNRSMDASRAFSAMSQPSRSDVTAIAAGALTGPSTNGFGEQSPTFSALGVGRNSLTGEGCYSLYAIHSVAKWVILLLKCSKFGFGWGSVSDRSAVGAHGAAKAARRRRYHEYSGGFRLAWIPLLCRHLLCPLSWRHELLYPKKN